MENITDLSYKHSERVQKAFEILNLGDYHSLYVTKSDTLPLADFVEDFRRKRFEIHELDPAHFLSVLGLTWQAYLKKIRFTDRP